MKCNPVNFGLAGGILFGALMFLMTLLSLWTGYADNFLNIFVSIYPGYTVSYLGSIIGLIYGFIDCFIGLYLLIWVYNFLEKK